MKFILVTSIIIVIMTIAAGMFLIYKQQETTSKRLRKVLKFNLFTFIPLLLMGIIMFVPDMVMAATSEEASTGGSGLGFIAAALSTGFATVGAGYAVGAVGSSALGAVSEDPKILGKTLIFVGLAEGIAIYGLIISILILGRL